MGRLCSDSLSVPLLGGSRSSSSRRKSFRKKGYNNNNNNVDDIELQLDKNGFQRFDEDMGKDSSASSGGWSIIFRKISLLVWKNFLFRKRHYVVTILEIILPTLFAVLLAYAKAKTPTKINGLDNEVKNVTVFPVIVEKDLVELLRLEMGDNHKAIAFCPNNTLTNKIIDRLKDSLNMPKMEWKAFNSEVEIESYNGQSGIASQKPLKAAIIFEDGFQKGDENFPTGQKLAYKLRLADNLLYTNELFPAFQIPGPGFKTAREYSEAGFSGFQVLLDKIIIGVLSSNGELPPETISLQAFPYPPFLFNFDFASVFNILMPTLLAIGFVFIVPSIVRGVVGEKETGIKELLKMYGLSSWMHWLGWMINSMLVLTISITIVVFLLFYPFNRDYGGLIEHSDPSVWWVFFFLYAMSSTAFCFFISAFFQRPTLATTVGIILWLVSFFALSHSTEKSYEYMSLFEKMLLCLIPNMALKHSIKILSAFEGKAIGGHWSNIFDSASSIDSLTLAHVFLMMIVSTFMYICLTLYVENILPSSYGVRKPWYYIFKKSTWYNPRVSINNSAISRSGMENQPSFEPDPSGLAPGIEIYNLRKTFGSSKVAVDDVTLKMFDGQITALLGHNGAGKTTTMSMLTGMFAPTSGTAIVNGHDINTDLNGVRSDLGMCTQHNMLFDKLTVAEHLIFFGRLKGLTKAQANVEMKEILQKLQLSDKVNVFSMSLSGGQKRKLNLGMALIGGSKVVILDEPTSGMDPEARRAIWDLLLEMRGHRTICLTTHFMEEADVLGDRIAIMSEGKVQCCGSPMFLKRYYGAGYTLRMTIEPKNRSDLILLTVKKYIENASFKSQHAPNSSEIAITLPTGKDTTSKFPGMFSDLSQNKEEFGIKTIGLSLTTMDEVFVKVGRLSHGGDDDEDEKPEEVTPETERKNRSNADLYINRLTGVKLASQQFYALLVKRYLYTLRKRRLFISQLALPVALLIVAILVTNGQYEPQNPSPPLKMSLDTYNKPLALYSANDQVLGENYKSLVGAYGINTKGGDGGSIIDELLDVGEKDLATYRERYIVGAEMNSSGIKALFSSIPYHASPLAINLASNTILRKNTPNKNYFIEVTSHPLRTEVGNILDTASSSPIFAKTIPILFAVFLPLGLALLAASYIVFPIEERLCKAKQLQLMTGVNPVIFWGSSFLWDFLVMILLICVMITCFPIFQSHGVFTAYNGGGVLFLIFLVYGFSAISFSYLLSLMVSTVPGGFSFVTILHVFSGMILCIVVYVLELSGFFSQANTFRSFARVFPTFGAAISVMQFTEKASMNSRCIILSPESKAILCDPKINIGDEFRSCCDNCTSLFPKAPCFEPQPYILWSEMKHAQEHPVDEIVVNEMEVPGIGQELLYLFLLGLFFKFLLIVIEFGVVKRLLASVFKTDSSVFQKQSSDSDVQAEKERVQGLMNTGSLFEDAIVVNNLCKSYGSFAAVSNISFGVHHGECFGLLGVNGAGKTTTFRMLTGDEIRSDGNAYAVMCSLQRDRKRFLSSIGYCPQFDGIVGVLTGKEMLELFCRLRGVQKNNIHAEASKWLVKLGLSESGNVQCQKYSGGMKRRLSAAMAMIGDPPIILLDEPTSGVDPVARRQFWKVISAVRDSGQAVILTSHSMEECEALCSRLGIMVNGQMQCLGGVQELKNKFAQGYSLVIKLKSMIATESTAVVSLTNAILEKFQPCNLKDQHQNILQFQVLNTTMPWDVLFTIMEDLKALYENIIEDYSVNETTLEDIFLNFARMQYPERRAEVPFIKKLMTCQCCQ